MITIAPLKALLAERDTSLEEFSAYCGITAKTLKAMYKGRCITANNVDKLCRTLNVQPYEVLTYEKNDPEGHWEWHND